MTPNSSASESHPSQSSPAPQGSTPAQPSAPASLDPPLIPEVLPHEAGPAPGSAPGARGFTGSTGSPGDRPPAAAQGWDEVKAKILRELEAIARFMDGAFEIPILGKSIGADALAGLLPVGGDLLTAIVSGYIVVRAKMMGVPKAKVWQMIGNIVIDTVLGSVPIAGDAFDVYWKANFRNIEIIRAHFGLDPFQP